MHLRIATDVDPQQKFFPYASNKQELVVNADDGFAPDAASEKYDPFAQWAWLDARNHEGM